MPSSRGSCWPRGWTCISCITGGFFTLLFQHCLLKRLSFLLWIIFLLCQLIRFSLLVIELVRLLASFWSSFSCMNLRNCSIFFCVQFESVKLSCSIPMLLMSLNIRLSVCAGSCCGAQDLWPLLWYVGSFWCGMWTVSCGMWDLVPWPGTEPWPPAYTMWKLNHWVTREIFLTVF